MDRIRDDRRIASKYLLRAVALVQIEIDDEDFGQKPVRTQVRNGDGDVVKDAEGVAAFGVGMVEPAAEL